jgi:hypothetical protein
MQQADEQIDVLDVTINASQRLNALATLRRFYLSANAAGLEGLEPPFNSLSFYQLRYRCWPMPLCHLQIVQKNLKLQKLNAKMSLLNSSQLPTLQGLSKTDKSELKIINFYSKTQHKLIYM